MRSINATLTTAQKQLNARPYRSLIIGPPGGTTYDASAYLVGYRYEEQPEVPGRHEITLDNSAGTFNTLTGALAPIAVGAPITLTRGVTIDTTDYSAELPRVWIEALEYTYRASRATLILHCIDAWEKLRRTRLTTDTTFTAQPAGAILAYIADAAGLTLDDVVLNGDFETYAAGPTWTPWVNHPGDGTIEDEGTIVHGGSHAVKISSGNDNDTWIYQDVTVTASRAYLLRVWARGDGSHSARYALYDNSNSAWIDTLTSLGVTAATYTQVDVGFAAPAGCTEVRLYLACPATDDDYCYVDDCQLLAGLDVTNLTLTFDILTTENLLNALDRLLRLVPQYAYFGLDGALKAKELDPEEASVYTLGWNAEHRLQEVQRSIDRAWEFNRVTVTGAGAYTGTAEDATQIAAVGTRQLTAHDVLLTSDAECLAAATATLRYFQARAQETILYTHPIHGLELFDVLTLDSPPWGGANVSGRVIGYLEIYDHVKGHYRQVITFGYPRHYVNRSTKDGSEIINIPGSAIVLESLQALTAHTGSLLVDGEIEIGTDGYLHSGQTSYATGTGFWLEYNAGTPRLSIGTAAGNRVTWNGTTLTIRGTVHAELGQLDALDVKGQLSVKTGGVIRSNQTAYDTGTGFWMEYNSGTPRFSIGKSSGRRMTWDGTYLTIRGNITAEDGELQDLDVKGKLTLSTSGVIRSGQTAYNTGTGFWMEYHSGSPRFSIGNPSGRHLTWDGSGLTLTADITAEDGELQDLDLKGDLNMITGGKLRSGQTAYNTGTGFWMGYNAGTPRFSIGQQGGNRVTWSGSTLTVIGTITAEDGELQDLDVKGKLTLGTSGVIRSGQTAYNYGTGFWMEYHSGTPRFSIGTGSGNRLTWNGSTLTIIGTITAEDGELDDLDVKGTLTLGSSGVIRSGQTGYGYGTGFWMEYNSGTPRMSIGQEGGNRLTWNGSTLTIVGTVTAESGELEDLSVTGTLNLNGSGKLLTRTSPNARIEINTSYLAGYSDATTKQFWLDASTGLAYAGGGKLKLTANGLYIRTPSSFMDAQSIRFVTDDSDEYDLVADKVQYTGGTITHQHLIGADSSEKPSGSYMQTHLFGTGVTQWYVYLAALSPSTGHSWLTVTNTPASNLSQLKFFGANSVEVDFEGSMSVESLYIGQYDPATRPADNDLIINGGIVVGAASGAIDPTPGTFQITDGVAAPGSTAGMATIYVDNADGDLKVRFADGHVAVIAADS